MPIPARIKCVFLTLQPSPHPLSSAPPSPLPAKCHSPSVCGSQPLWFHFTAPLPPSWEIRPHPESFVNSHSAFVCQKWRLFISVEKVPASQSGWLPVIPNFSHFFKTFELEALSRMHPFLIIWYLARGFSSLLPVVAKITPETEERSDCLLNGINLDPITCFVLFALCARKAPFRRTPVRPHASWISSETSPGMRMCCIDHKMNPLVFG